MNNEPLLALRGVTKNYGAVRAIDGVTFEVYPGEIVALVGDNGAGKSTTVKIIAGAIRPDEGELYFDGQARHWASPHAAQEAGIETLYQDAGLAPHLSVPGNIFLGRELKRAGFLGKLGFMDGATMEERSRLMLAKLQVNVPSGSYPAEDLSGGQRQAVAIAKSLMWAKKLVLFDEPTNHLGVQGTGQVLELLRRSRDEGQGIVLISHTIPHVLEVADRIVVLWQGRIGATFDAKDADIDRVVKAITGGVSA